MAIDGRETMKLLIGIAGIIVSTHRYTADCRKRPRGAFKKEEGQKLWMSTSTNLKAAQTGDDKNTSKKLEVEVIQKKSY